jgi:hypothetical protein
MFFHTTESDRSIPDERSVNSHSEEASESTTSRRSSRTGSGPSYRELSQPAGDEDECPISDDKYPSSSDKKDLAGEIHDKSAKLRKTPIPPKMLRTSVSPRAKQQFIRFEYDLAAELQAEYMAKGSPLKPRNNSKITPTIDMRLKGNIIHIGGCWGSVDLTEAVDFKPRKRQEIGLVNPIVAPTKGADGSIRTVFIPTNSQLPETPLPRYLV